MICVNNTHRHPLGVQGACWLASKSLKEHRIRSNLLKQRIRLVMKYSTTQESVIPNEMQPPSAA